METVMQEDLAKEPAWIRSNECHTKTLSWGRWGDPNWWRMDVMMMATSLLQIQLKRVRTRPDLGWEWSGRRRLTLNDCGATTWLSSWLDVRLHHFLLWCIQAIWRTQGKPILIDLGNDFFIVKLSRRGEFERALSECPWMIGDDYLHVQQWQPNFIAESTKISTLPVWVWFPQLYTEEWLKRARDNIGRTIKFDSTLTFTIMRRKFARMWIEIDLHKPLRAFYKMRGKEWQLQYEGPHELCFICGKYGHKNLRCRWRQLRSHRV